MNANSEINIGIARSSQVKVAELLNALLADEYMLYTKTRNFHWNVVGPHFNELHKFFETQYELLDQSIDDIAERARALGENAVGTLTEFLKLTSLHEQPGEHVDAHQMLSILLADHETIIRSLRIGLEVCAEEHHDAGTSDFLTGLMEQHEKMAWMLRSFLK
jgi:starvation-inducible DNA-binding protein